MEAGGTTNEDFKHPLREIKIKLNKKLLDNLKKNLPLLKKKPLIFLSLRVKTTLFPLLYSKNLKQNVLWLIAIIA